MCILEDNLYLVNNGPSALNPTIGLLHLPPQSGWPLLLGMPHPKALTYSKLCDVAAWVMIIHYKMEPIIHNNCGILHYFSLPYYLFRFPTQCPIIYLLFKIHSLFSKKYGSSVVNIDSFEFGLPSWQNEIFYNLFYCFFLQNWAKIMLHPSYKTKRSCQSLLTFFKMVDELEAKSPLVPTNFCTLPSLDAIVCAWLFFSFSLFSPCY